MTNTNLNNDDDNPIAKIILLILIFIVLIRAVFGSSEQSINCVPNAGCTVITKTNRFARAEAVSFNQSDINHIEISSYDQQITRGRFKTARTETYYYPVIILNDNRIISLRTFQSLYKSEAENLADKIKQNIQISIEKK